MLAGYRKKAVFPALLVGMGLPWGVSPSAAGVPRISATTAAKYTATLVARGFVQEILRGAPESAARLAADPLNIDGQIFRGGRAIEDKLARLGRLAKRRRLHIRAAEALTHSAMRSRFGPPPKRIAKSAHPRAYYVLIRFQRRGVVVIVKGRGRSFQVIGMTD